MSTDADRARERAKENLAEAIKRMRAAVEEVEQGVNQRTPDEAVRYAMHAFAWAHASVTSCLTRSLAALGDAQTYDEFRRMEGKP